jgi:Glyoxalase/Bleomycin resistance protein/Dioxygenase superfamily
MIKNLSHHPVRQIAYFVPHAVAAARSHSALFGSGPYYVAEHIPLSSCQYRGRPGELDHTSAYGQWGEVMVEFVQQNNPGPSVFHDMYPPGRQGMHHVALIVKDLPGAMRHFEAAGHVTGLYAVVKGSEVPFVMMDCVATHGHFVELYEPTEALLGFYELVRSSAQNWDGSEPIRKISFG